MQDNSFGGQMVLESLVPVSDDPNRLKKGKRMEEAARLSAEAEGAGDLPLCVDLDGTLVNTDTLVESFVAALTCRPGVVLHMPGWLMRGKAVLKAELAGRAALDAAHLPYNAPLRAWLEREKARGRRLVLATAADHRIAEAVAGHLGLFEAIVASNGSDNLRGPAKAAALVALFGERGFDYAGNHAEDLRVWAHARGAVLVNTRRGVRRRVPAGCEVAGVIEGRQPWPPALIEVLRPRQWARNALVLVPVVATGAIGEFSAMMQTLLALVAFCATLSGTHVLRGLVGLQADRRHPRKRPNAFADGDLPLVAGLVLGPLLLALGLALGLAVSIEVAAMVAAYAVISTLDPGKPKGLPLVDAALPAFLYTIPVLAGGLASGHPVPLWLLGGALIAIAALARRTTTTGRPPNL
jgi:phosphoserine phosphatase